MLNLNFSVLEPLRGKLSPFLTDLQYLNYLDVSFNDFNQSPIPESIGSLSSLSLLDVQNANFGRNIPFQLGNLSRLQYLDLSYNHFNNPKNLEWLSQLSSLKYLGMGGINLSKFNNQLQVVNKIPYYSSLFLENCNLANIFSIPLANSCTSLDALYLPYSGLTSASSVLEWLFNYNTSVVELYLFGNQFQDMIPNAFTLQQKMFITTKKIVAITSKSLQQFALQKNFVAINLKYFNENFDVIIYLLLQ